MSKRYNHLNKDVKADNPTKNNNKYTKNGPKVSTKTNKHGYLGKFFGFGRSAENNIAGAIALIFAATICLKWLFCNMEAPNNYITLLSTIIAYLLGDRHHKK